MEHCTRKCREEMKIRQIKRQRREFKNFVVSMAITIFVIMLIAAEMVSQNTVEAKMNDLSLKLDTIGQSIKNDEKTVTTDTESLEAVFVDSYTDAFTITHYCSCVKCCGKSDGITATGTKATAGRTAGVDPNVIPLGSEIEIGGVGYIAEDTGNFTGNVIDIYVGSHEEALRLGKFERKVTVKGI